MPEVFKKFFSLLKPNPDEVKVTGTGALEVDAIKLMENEAAQAQIQALKELRIGR